MYLTIKFIKHDTDDNFRCPYDLSFQSANGIHRHAKRCRREATTFVTSGGHRGDMWRRGIAAVSPPNHSTERTVLGDSINAESFIALGVLPVYLREFETVICLRCGFAIGFYSVARLRGQLYFDWFEIKKNTVTRRPAKSTLLTTRWSAYVVFAAQFGSRLMKAL